MKSNQKVACRLDLNGYGVLAGNSWVEARMLEHGFAIYCGADVDILPDPIHVTTSKEHYSWRKFAKSLLSISDGWIVTDACDHVEVQGESEIQADILRIAWSQDKELTDWLLSQTDKGLNIIKAQFSSLVDEESREFLYEFVAAIDELNAEPQLEKLHSIFTPDALTTDIQSILTEMEKRITYVNDVMTNAREERIAPFLSDIERIASNYDDTPVRGGGITAPSQRSRVVSWLRNYVGEYGQLPQGRHKVSIPFFGGHISAGEIDFSKFTEVTDNVKKQE